MSADKTSNTGAGSMGAGAAGDAWLDSVRWNDDGLVSVITREARSGVVLMSAWMNREALRRSLREGRACYWSRSRRCLWRKGDTSGNFQEVCGVRLDCDADTLLLDVIQHGAGACHTGRMHCFFRRLRDGAWKEEKDHDEAPRPPDAESRLEHLALLLEQRRQADPAHSYVAALHRDGLDRILKKVGEEAAETIIAAKGGEPAELIHETADLWFHTLVLLAHMGLGPREVLAELERRRPPRDSDI